MIFGENTPSMVLEQNTMGGSVQNKVENLYFLRDFLFYPNRNKTMKKIKLKKKNYGYSLCFRTFSPVTVKDRLE